MKIVAYLFLFLTITTLATDLRRPITSKQVETLNEIIKDKKWASIILKLAELHMMAKGPVDTLVSAIEGVVSDLGVKLETAHNDYALVVSEHEAEVRRINDLIREAELDINNSEQLINNILVPQKLQLEEEITNLERRITDLNDHVTEATSEREVSHEGFVERQTEHTEAIAACTEALEILDTLLNGETSLVQISKTKQSLENVQNKLRGTMTDPFVKALLSLSQSEFANTEAINQVIDLLNQIRNSLTASLLAEQEAEVNDEAEFVADMTQTRTDLSEAQNQLTEAQTSHSQNEESIVSNQDFITQRSADKLGNENDLQLENDGFQRDTDNYNALVTQFTKELDACTRALEVLNSAEIADYIGNRMEQDRVIDSQHGSQLRVNDDNFRAY